MHENVCEMISDNYHYQTLVYLTSTTHTTYTVGGWVYTRMCLRPSTTSSHYYFHHRAPRSTDATYPHHPKSRVCAAYTALFEEPPCGLPVVLLHLPHTYRHLLLQQGTYLVCKALGDVTPGAWAHRAREANAEGGEAEAVLAVLRGRTLVAITLFINDDVRVCVLVQLFDPGLDVAEGHGLLTLYSSKAPRAPQ